MKYFPPPPKYDNCSEMLEKPKLRIMEKVPPPPAPNMRQPKMIKNLRFMRGPELIHNKLIHKHFGIIALGGGRLHHGHFEMMRLTINRKLEANRMFAVWRVDPPWQPITKKGIGHRMGGGKGNIDHFVTPVKSGRVILEVGGQCEYGEVKRWLKDVANKLPFKAMAVNQEIMEKRAAEEERIEHDNINPYTFEYLIKNNIQNCRFWIKRIDLYYFGKYL